MAARVGIDIGGTFTDGVLVDGDRVRIAKVPSVPEDPAQAIMDCCDKLGADLRDIAILIHGTTIGTNAVLEKKGPPIAHVTTSGFRDILHIRRGDSEPYNLLWQPPEPVVRRRDIFEVPERVAWDGSVVREFDEEAARRVAQIIAERGYPAVSVVFLHSYANADHEDRMNAILQDICPGVPVSLSYKVLPHYREFERSTTTAVNAYLMPLMAGYLSELTRRMKDAGFATSPLIMQSNGGVMTAAEAGRLPARTLRSGPAGGAVAAMYIGDELQLDDAIFIDIGGTSTEVAVRHGGQLRWTPELEFSPGLPIRFPSVEIHSIGAGGGSIAWVHGGSFLKVGPRSAGAVPGPACYGRGGTEPTTTDAQVVLGRLNPAALLGGEMPIDAALAHDVITEKIARPLSMSTSEAALGILRVTTNNMMQAIRLMTVNRGLDPRESCLIAFGGGGPLYAVEVARLLGIRKVVVPAFSGVTSAFGMVRSDFSYDESATLLWGEQELDADRLIAVLQELETRVSARLEEAGIPSEDRQLSWFVDMRYEGQGFELPVRISDASRLDGLRAAFHLLHQREFGWSHAEWPVEAVFARVSGVGAIRGKPARAVTMTEGSAREEARTCRFLDEPSSVEARVIHRHDVDTGERVVGPAIIEQIDTTTLLPPGAAAIVDADGNLIISPNEEKRNDD